MPVSRLLATVVLAVVPLSLSGCGAAVISEPVGAQAPQPSGPAGDDRDHLSLVGIWRVTAAGEGDQAALRISPYDFQLSRQCGLTSGFWRGDGDGLFLADTFSWSMGCPDGTRETPWLLNAATYEVDGEERVLRNAMGEELARLRPGGRIPPHPHYTDEYTQVPEVDERTRRAPGPPAPLPDGISPATSDALVGRWVRAERLPTCPPPGADRARSTPVPVGSNCYPQQPYAELSENGHWGAFGGCNRSGGRWAAGADGRVLSFSGMTAGVGCDVEDVPVWKTETARAGFDGETLVLFDSDGKRIGRLVRG